MMEVVRIKRILVTMKKRLLASVNATPFTSVEKVRILHAGINNLPFNAKSDGYGTTVLSQSD